MNDILFDLDMTYPIALLHRMDTCTVSLSIYVLMVNADILLINDIFDYEKQQRPGIVLSSRV